MRNYSIDDVCLLAKRINNNKRSYLIVDPLQGKHIPASPEKTEALCTALGERLAAAAPDAGLVIGFAETATAVGAIAAMSFPDDTLYQHTTREPLTVPERITFMEEHSHAVLQQIDGRVLSGLHGGTVVMIDDEISTGNTVVNMIGELRKSYPGLRDTRFVVGSVICRMSEERLAELEKENIRFEALVYHESGDLGGMTGDIAVSEPSEQEPCGQYREISIENLIPGAVSGISVSEYRAGLDRTAAEAASALGEALRPGSRIAVIGTEECMTAAIMLGSHIRELCGDISVFTHSTTRSPIGVCDREGYPCRSGIRLPSFYEEGRQTFLYNIADYDTVAVVTDSRNGVQTEQAMSSLAGAFAPADIYLIRG